MKRHGLAVLLLLLFSYWSIRPLLLPGFFPMHDDTQVARVVVMGQALRHGQFPVRWVSDLGYGYGYPVFNFYGPLPYYVGGALYALGLDGLLSTKIMLGLGFVGAGLAMYALASTFFGLAGGLLAGLFYLYAPYHAVQLYVRGAVGEFWALVFLPWLVLGFWQLRAWPKQTQGIAIGALGLSGVILSHTIVGYLTSLFVIVALAGTWIIAAARGRWSRSQSVSQLLLVVVGLGLSAFFWLPAIVEMRFTSVVAQIGASADFHSHFVCLSQLWNSVWGFGGSAAGCLDGFSFKLGKIHLLAALVALVLFWWRRPKSVPQTQLLLAALGLTLVSVFFMLPISTKLWELIPLMAYVQYPWRFLAFSIFGLSLLVGSLGLIHQRFWRWVVALTLVIGLMVGNAKWFAPQYSYSRPAAEFETAIELRQRVSRISDEYLPAGVVRPGQTSDIVHATIRAPEEVLVETEIDTETYVKSYLTNSQPQTVVIQRAFFPGWRFWVNGKRVEPLQQEGLPVLSVPAGKNVVEARFGNTIVRNVANFVSLLTLGMMILYYGKKTVA